jgi:hypothetical protein
VVISNRQVVRLLVVGLETFRAEDEEVLTAGLSSSRFVTVDDTGARHKNKSGFTSQIGSDRFTVFRTGASKSRLAFLRNLLGGAARYVVNEQALVYMRANSLPEAALDKLAGCATPVFPSHEDWMRGLNGLSLTGLLVTPDPMGLAFYFATAMIKLAHVTERQGVRERLLYGTAPPSACPCPRVKAFSLYFFDIRFRSLGYPRVPRKRIRERLPASRLSRPAPLRERRPNGNAFASPPGIPPSPSPPRHEHGPVHGQHLAAGLIDAAGVVADETPGGALGFALRFHFRIEGDDVARPHRIRPA